MRNSLSNNLPFGIIIILFVVGCRKDPYHTEVEPEPSYGNGCSESWCDEFPEPPEIGYNYTSDGVQYFVPCFNPNNANEFVYIRTGSASSAELVKYDLTTNEQTVLLNPMSMGRPDWGRQGWITFVYTFNHVWKIYEDGSQLTQLTSGEDDKFPTFNYSGNEIYYLRKKWYSNFELDANPDLYKNTKMLIMDINGNVIDSVMIPNIHNVYQSQFTYQTWLNGAFDLSDNVYFMEGTDNLQGIYKMGNDTILKVHEWYSPQSFEDIDVFGTNVFYTKYKKGIFKMDSNTGTETKIKWGCDSRHYRSISISADGKKMLVQKVVATLSEDGQSIDEQNEIWLLDVNGCEERKILGE